MLNFLIRIKRTSSWWRVTLLRDGSVKTYAFVPPLLISWLRGILKEKK